MIRSILLVACLATAAPADAPRQPDADRPVLDWQVSQLPPLPDEFGFAGPFAGVSDGVLIVAGGANFPDGVPWEKVNGAAPQKVYHDEVFVLVKTDADAASPDYRWIRSNAKLPRRIGYGVSITTLGGIVCLGGEWRDYTTDPETGKVTSTTRRTSDVFVLAWNAAKRTVEISPKLPSPGESPKDILPLPPLPEACSAMGGAMIGETIYIAGGASRAGAASNFWSLDLSGRKGASPGSELKWKTLPTWPGPPRQLPVVVAQNDGRADCLYVLSGRRQVLGVTQPLTDAYRFRPAVFAFELRVSGGDKKAAAARAWRRVADVAPPGEKPRCVMGAAAIDFCASHILVFGGDDGERLLARERLEQRLASLTEESPEFADAERKLQAEFDDHRGFPAEVLAYDTITDRWAAAGQLPATVPVTTTAVMFNGAVVIPSGEIRPGVRSPQVLSIVPRRQSRGFGAVNWAVVAAYMVLLVGMGVYFARREKSTADFFLAGGRIPWWAAGLSIFATMLSAITYLSIPAKAYAVDWTRILLNAGILAIAPIVIFLYLPFFRRLKVTSAYEYLEKRFDVSIRLLGSTAFVVFQLARMGIVILLPALALSAVTGIDVWFCIAMIGLLSTIYTVLGGIEAVIWTDVVQVVVLIGGALAALFIIAGNLDGGFSQIVADGAAMGKFHLANLHWDFTRDALAVILIGAIFTNLVPYTTDQAVIQRYLTTADERQAARAVWTNAILSIPASLLFFFAGTALFVFYRAHPGSLAPLEKVDQIFPWFIAQEMPAGLGGLVIAGVFAAAMSSLDSSMHSISTAITTDFVRRLGPQRSERELLAIARWLIVLLGIVGTGTAMLMASVEIKFLWDHFMNLMGLLGGTLAGLFALGIFTRRPAAVHAWIGAAASFGALAYVRFATQLSGLLYAAIGIGVCFAVGLFAGMIFPARAKDVVGLTIYTVRAAGRD